MRLTPVKPLGAAVRGTSTSGSVFAPGRKTVTVTPGMRDNMQARRVQTGPLPACFSSRKEVAVDFDHAEGMERNMVMRSSQTGQFVDCSSPSEQPELADGPASWKEQREREQPMCGLVMPAYEVVEQDRLGWSAWSVWLRSSS